MDTMLKFFYILTFGMAIFISTVKTDAPCINDDTTIDAYGDTCTSYYDDKPSQCGKYDTDYFNSSAQCCACIALKKDPCKQEFGAYGPCEAFHPHYSYNATAGECQQFVYGGCEGNYNRFPSWLECHHICIETGGDSLATKPKEEGQPCYDFGLEKGGCGKNLICSYDDHHHHGHDGDDEHMTCLATLKEGEECHTIGFEEGGCGRGLKCVTMPTNWWESHVIRHTCHVPKKIGESCEMTLDDCVKGLSCSPVDPMPPHLSRWSCIDPSCYVFCFWFAENRIDCLKTMCGVL